MAQTMSSKASSLFPWRVLVSSTERKRGRGTHIRYWLGRPLAQNRRWRGKVAAADRATKWPWPGCYGQACHVRGLPARCPRAPLTGKEGTIVRPAADGNRSATKTKREFAR